MTEYVLGTVVGVAVSVAGVSVIAYLAHLRWRKRWLEERRAMYQAVWGGRERGER